MTPVIVFVAAAALGAADNAALVWDEAVLHGIRQTRPGPTIAARALAVTHTAMFDAWSAYDRRAVPTAAGKAAAVSYAGYRAAVDLFPSEASHFECLLRDQGYDPAITSTDVSTPAGVGNRAATAVLEARHRDGSNQLGDRAPGAYADYTGYVPSIAKQPNGYVDPNRWLPLSVVVHGGAVGQTFTTPQWGLVTPFALESASALRPPGPPVYPDPQYKAEADEILALSGALTDEQKTVTEYWADGPSSEFPPGHWALFAQWVSRRDHHALDDDVKMFFILSNAMLDASIAAWDAKRFYDSVRPVTAIRFLYRTETVWAWAGPGKGAGWIPGAMWKPYQFPDVGTPPFPEFFSGHSVFSAAAAEVLKRFTGSDTFGYSVTLAAGSCRAEPGFVPAQDVTLKWATFSEAADAAGMSRRYGGIHFRTGDMAGRHIGREIGRLVWEKAKRIIDGNPTPADLDRTPLRAAQPVPSAR